MKLQKLAGATSEIWQVFIRDSSSATGAGLTGLAYGTSGLTAYYHRDTDTTATAISLATMTIGTFTSSGFKEIDSTNMPGWYQFCPPNAALASGAKSCGIHLKGATNMAPLPIEVQLTAVNPDSITAFITAINSLAPPASWNTDIVQTGDAFARIGSAGAGLTALPAALLSTVMTQGYAANGSAPTLAQMLFMLLSALGQFSITGTSIVCLKLDGVTTAMTYTLDSATTPTTRTRTS